MTQTLALLIDAYRELNARKMFWISLIISGLVMASFALLGVSDDGLTLLTMEMSVPAPRFWYKYIFSFVVIGIWISWGAVILGLVSTGGIFPELVASGAIDLYLSKPISRLRLFLTKYLGGLIFALLQATIFAVGCYLVFGWRSGQWKPALFLIIPLTTLMFSYLFAVCVLLGVLTRSTVAALLLTILVWLVCALANRAEQLIFQMRTALTAEVVSYERQAAEADDEIVRLKQNPTFTNMFGIRERRAKERREAALAHAEEARGSAGKWATAHRIAAAMVAVIPKTNETIDLLDRKIFDDADRLEFRQQMTGQGGAFADPGPQRRRPANPTTSPATPEDTAATQAADHEQQRQVQQDVQEATERAARSRSVPWILGTSIGFEVVVLAVAAWVFCRRDY